MSAPDESEPTDLFHAPTRRWFAEHFPGPTPVQERGWRAIAGGSHALLVAPTGSGKTLAAFLWAIDRLTSGPPPAADETAGAPEPGVRVLYVSPLKALVYDVERNLRTPLAGVQRAAERLGLPFRALRVDVRTGDTPQRERQRQRRDPAEILVTTPESLFLLLGSQARETLRSVRTVIVDEIHALAPTKRGAHLALSLERLAEACATDPQRIGLSATARPLELVARFLGGRRAVEVIDASAPPRLALRVKVTVGDMTHVTPPAPEPEPRGGPILARRFEREADPYGLSPGDERGIWPALYPELLAEVRAHRSTILFVNSRGLCERLTGRLNELAGEELVHAHHGSVSHERRARIEDRLKRGEIRGLVATSSLELGIDMGAIDRVLLIESPGSVARGLQRVGRAGHEVGGLSEGVLYPKFRGDLLESAVVARRMLAGQIEALATVDLALDVLAQQLVAMCCDATRSVEELERLCRRAHPYRSLSREALEKVLGMLSGAFAGGDFAELRPRLRWDRARDLVSARRGAALVSRMNAGTIPDRGAFAVHLGADGPRIGELDEEMVYESRRGDTFLLGASTWRVEEITRDRVVVSPAPGEPGRMPFWKGDGPGRPLELGRAIGAFVRELEALPREAAERLLSEELPLDANAATNLLEHLGEQAASGSAAPTDRRIVVERFRDELGDWRVCILSPFGAPVHGPWAMALRGTLSARSGVDVEVLSSDDGLVLRFADADELPELEELFPASDEVDELVTQALDQSSLYAALFRENAVRSLLVTRRRPEQRSPLWAQRLKAKALLATVRRYPDFPIVLETYRQALRDVFDLDGLRSILADVETRAIRVHACETLRPSPFARSLVFAYVAAYLYEGDSPLAERRAQALTLDRGLLSELVGQPELRELLDGEAVAQVEAELAGRAEERRARDRDELADLLARVGDLRIDEIAQRVDGPDAADPDGVPDAAVEPEELARAWLATLRAEVRAVPVRIAGEERWIAAEDAGLVRDALGCVPPGGLPEAFLAPRPDALEQLLGRWARVHGPFQAREPARRFGLLEAQVTPVLQRLEERGVLVLGEIRPGGSELDWCDAEVLRRIKRRTLGRLRGQAAAVAPETFARFLLDWQQVGGEPRRDALEEALVGLEGLSLPWSALVDSILPARAPGFRVEALDALGAAGRFGWIGHGALGPRDGRVALWRREELAVLLEPGAASGEAGRDALEPLARELLEALRARGASFTTELERALRARFPDLDTRAFEGALWDLVWRGLVTNDTFQPLSALRRPAARGPRGRARALRPGRGTRRGGSTTGSGGRWSLVDGLADPSVTPHERALARAELLLERYGVVGREMAQAEELPGGFSAVHPALRALEDAGRVQRGHFVEGLSGAQFALSPALERLRRERDPGERPAGERRVDVLAATDPASPWGALLPWPLRPSGTSGASTTAAEAVGAGPRPRRVAGAEVVCVDGACVLWVAPSRRQLVRFAPADDEATLVRALGALARAPRRGRLLVVERIDGLEVARSPCAAALAAAGFVADYRGFVALGVGERQAE